MVLWKGNASQNLHNFFRETPVKSIDRTDNKDYVIFRLLEFGGRFRRQVAGSGVFNRRSAPNGRSKQGIVRQSKRRGLEAIRESAFIVQSAKLYSARMRISGRRRETADRGIHNRGHLVSALGGFSDYS